jgi:hypothetical protein
MTMPPDTAKLSRETQRADPRLPSAQDAAQTFFTVKQYSEAQPAFSLAALRNLIFKAQKRYTSKGTIGGNGLLEAGAIIRVGRKVLIDAERFAEWVRRQNEGRT